MSPKYGDSYGSESIGSRIHVMGNSCSGKSSLGQELATLLDTPFVELDALNWLPNWVGLNETDPELLHNKLVEATRSDAWVVAGSYHRFCERAFWPRLQTVVWLDLPLPLLLIRMLRRSWNRWRSRELLWGTNYEQFWPQLYIWNKEDSLLWWIVSQHNRKRSDMHAYMTDPQWAHVHFVRLSSQEEIRAFKDQLSKHAHCP